MWPDANEIIKNTEGFTVIRDTREQNGWIWEPNDRCAGMIDKTLPTGDYTIVGAESTLCIERKASVSEIANNLSEKRFPKFLDRFSKFKYAFLIAECSFEDVIKFPTNSNVPVYLWDKLYMKGKLLIKKITEIQLQYNLNIIWAGSPSNGRLMADSIFKRVYDDISKSK